MAVEGVVQLQGEVETAVDTATSHRVSIGMVLPTFPQRGGIPLDLGWQAATAESLGVATLWSCDHLFWHGPSIECFVTTTLAAASTSDCMVGTGVLQLPLRSAATVAKTAASIQDVSRGRLILGVGVGEHRGEYEAAAVEFRNRGRRADLAIAEVQRWWNPGPENGYAQYPVPQPIPIWIGGRSERSRRRAAEFGDGWLPMFLSPAQLAEHVAALHAELEQKGRSRTDVTVGMVLPVCVGDNSRATEAGLSWMSSLWRLPPERFSQHLIAGNPEDCAEALMAYSDAGAEHLAIFFAEDQPLTMLEGLMEAWCQIGGRRYDRGIDRRYRHHAARTF